MTTVPDAGRQRVLVSTPFFGAGHPVLQPLHDADVEITHAVSRELSADQWSEVLAGVDGVIAANDPFPAAVLAAAPRLRVIARSGVGYDSIDVDAATERGVAVCLRPGLNHRAVAEHALLLTLAAARRLGENLHEINSGRWMRHNGDELGALTIGIVGLGRIGKRLVELLAPFEPEIIAFDEYQDTEFAAAHHVTYVSSDELLRRSDIVSLHLALSEQTRHWLSTERLAVMKSTAQIVNTARGGIIDQAALVTAIESGSLGGAALDVMYPEPLPADSELRGLPSLLLTPHIGGSTAQARDIGGSVAVSNVLAVLRGETPPDAINPGYIHHVHQPTPFR